MLNCFMLSSLYLVSLLFPDLLSLHLVNAFVISMLSLNIESTNSMIPNCQTVGIYMFAHTIGPLLLKNICQEDLVCN